MSYFEQPLITRYRPQSFDEVVGHDEIVTALSKRLKEPAHPHAYLLTGSGGLGKTTLARLIADALECDVTEIAAAANNGIDDVRSMIELGQHMSMRGSGRRAFIIDECHGLSKAAWQALLKLLEEPPAHLYLMLCTTELTKVPDTVRQRCYHIPLRVLPTSQLAELLEAVIAAEEWTVANDVLDAVLQAAEGSPRRALSTLQAVHDLTSREEVQRVIQLQNTDDSPIIEICQMLLRGRGTWENIRVPLAKIEDDDWDQSIILACRYLASCLLRETVGTKAMNIWGLLDVLVSPMSTFDRKVAFYVALGRIIWGGE